MPEKTRLERIQQQAEDSSKYLKGIKHGMRIKNALSCKQYIIFFYKYVLEYSNPTIADITGLTEATIRQHLFRAKEKIKEIEKNL
jgi:DNA-directed RNA polymerase specialized sigma24 family protein